jgi:hypothetical protein
MGCQKLQYYSAQIPFYLWNPEPVKERAENVVQMWLSVDPMADKYPNLSPYNYCMNNPIMLIDPNGDSTRYYYKGQLLGTTYDSHNDAIVDYSMWDKETVMARYNTSMAEIDAKGVDKASGDLRKLGVVYELDQFDTYMNEADTRSNPQFPGYQIESLSYIYLTGSMEAGYKAVLGPEDITGTKQYPAGSPGNVDRYFLNADKIHFGPRFPNISKSTIHNHANSGEPMFDGPFTYADNPSGADITIARSMSLLSIVYSPTRIYFHNSSSWFYIPRTGRRF